MDGFFRFMRQHGVILVAFIATVIAVLCLLFGASWTTTAFFALVAIAAGITEGGGWGTVLRSVGKGLSFFYLKNGALSFVAWGATAFVIGLAMLTNGSDDGILIGMFGLSVVVFTPIIKSMGLMKK